MALPAKLILSYQYIESKVKQISFLIVFLILTPKDKWIFKRDAIKIIRKNRKKKITSIKN